MKQTLKKIIDYVVGAADPDMVILFGSMANGLPNVFSDVDLLIITENSPYKKDIAARIISYSNELSLKTDVLIYSRSEMERESQKPNSFIAAIIESGKVVYKKKIKKKLAFLKKVDYNY